MKNQQQIFEIISEAILKIIGDESVALEISEQIMKDIIELSVSSLYIIKQQIDKNN